MTGFTEYLPSRYLLQNNLPGSSLTRDFIWSLIKSSPTLEAGNLLSFTSRSIWEGSSFKRLKIFFSSGNNERFLSLIFSFLSWASSEKFSSSSTSSTDSTNLAPSLISPLVPWLLGLANAPQLAKKQLRYTDYYGPIMGKYQNKGVCQLNTKCFRPHGT